MIPQLREGDKEVNGVNPLGAAAGLCHLGEHLDQRHPCEEGGLVLERVEPGCVDELEDAVVGAAIDGALA